MTNCHITQLATDQAGVWAQVFLTPKSRSLPYYTYLLIPTNPLSVLFCWLPDCFVCWVAVGVHSPSFPLLKQITTHLHSCKMGQNCSPYKTRSKSFLCSSPAMWAWAASLIALSLGVPIYKMEWNNMYGTVLNKKWLIFHLHFLSCFFECFYTFPICMWKTNPNLTSAV